MKQVFLLTGVAALLSTSAQAVEFNTEALKTMQQEGHRIVEESQGGRAYRAANDFCLDVAGDGMVVRKCNVDSKTQKWIADEQGRLVAHDGRCVDGATLGKCGGTKSQKWNHDGKKRLSNNNKQCLQVQGHPPKAGAKVVAVQCNDKAPNQVWK
jgi:hypothetical protein